MVIEVVARKLQDRMLWNDALRGVLSRYVATVEEIPQTFRVSRQELLAAPRDLALKGAREVFRRFGWNPPLDTMKDH